MSNNIYWYGKLINFDIWLSDNSLLYSNNINHFTWARRCRKCCMKSNFFLLLIQSNDNLDINISSFAFCCFLHNQKYTLHFTAVDFVHSRQMKSIHINRLYNIIIFNLYRYRDWRGVRLISKNCTIRSCCLYARAVSTHGVLRILSSSIKLFFNRQIIIRDKPAGCGPFKWNTAKQLRNTLFGHTRLSRRWKYYAKTIFLIK